MAIDSDDKAWIEKRISKMGEFNRAVFKDKLKHPNMSEETGRAVKKLESSMGNIDKELRKLSDNDILRNEKLKQIVGLLEKQDEIYAKKSDLELLEAKVEPVMKRLNLVGTAIILTIVTAVLALVITS